MVRLALAWKLLPRLTASCTVNTRCLYDDLGMGREDNISLCPIFDFANHAWTGATMRPQSGASPSKPGSSTLRDLTCATLDTRVQPNQELFLTYGAHANVRLFVDYGFVNSVSEDEVADYPGEILIDDVEEAILQQTAKDVPTDLSRWRDELEEQGYWLYVFSHCIYEGVGDNSNDVQRLDVAFGARSCSPIVPFLDGVTPSACSYLEAWYDR